MEDAVVRAVLMEVCGPQEAQHGIGWALGEHSIVFYAYYGCISGRSPNWVQMILTAVVRIFKRFILHMNLVKTNTMVYSPGFIFRHHVEVTYKNRATWEGGGVQRAEEK